MTPGARTKIIAITASAKKAGKSTVASHLVRELNADYGLKVSTGGGHGASGDITTDPGEISRPGTDTGALVAAGANKVVWVHARDPERLGGALDEALAMFPPGGLLVVEGNSAVRHIEPDFTVFLMSTPIDRFKPSARQALEKADIVLVDAEARDSADPRALEVDIESLSPGTKIISYRGDLERGGALEDVARLARAAIEHVD